MISFLTEHAVVVFPVVVIAGLALMQAVYVVAYLRFLRQPLSLVDDQSLASPPRTAVILCLRGADPGLVDCLERLFTLDAQNYELHLVFDDQDDPARTVVESYFQSQFDPPQRGFWYSVQREPVSQPVPAGRPPVVFHRVADHGSGRSLKCSALTTAIMELPVGIEIVALVDSDAVVERDWLNKLIQPLADPAVGASTGNRWFEPAHSTGGMVRKIWNAAALPQMSLYRIAWGGSLALRRKTIDELGLLDRWSVAFCEDTLLNDAFADSNCRIVRVPDLIVVNRESSSLRDAFRWIRRQLLTVRLYHAAWPWVVLHALVGGGCLLGLPLVGLYLALSGQWTGLAAVAGGWFAFQLLNLILLELIERGNRRVGSHGPPPDGQAKPRSGIPVTSARGILANLLLQVCYPFLVIGANFQQRVQWRGIEYRLGRKARIELLQYRPYRAAPSTDSSRSIH